MTQLIEKLAEACRDARTDVPGYTPSLTDYRIVKTILQHLRDDPTPEMIDVGEYHFEGCSTPGPLSSSEPPSLTIFRAILNTALGEE